MQTSWGPSERLEIILGGILPALGHVAQQHHSEVGAGKASRVVVALGRVWRKVKTSTITCKLDGRGDATHIKSGEMKQGKKKKKKRESNKAQATTSTTKQQQKQQQKQQTGTPHINTTYPF